MYLVRRKRKDWKPKTKKEKNEQILEKLKGIDENENFEIGYWRKVNAIHGWFIRNCGKDYDDREMLVSKEQLQELLSLVIKVKQSKSNEIADELLPTESGFFFGDTEYDNYYFSSLDDTEKIIKSALETDFSKYEVIYVASW